MTLLLAAASVEIDRAAMQPATEAEATLSRVVTMLGNLTALARECAPGDRVAAYSQVLALRARLNQLSRVMARSAEIFRGYGRQTGSFCDEYSPGGLAQSQREPAFFTFSV